MSRVFLVLFLFLISLPAFAGRLVISSLPDTVYQSQHSGDAWDTVTIQGTRLSSPIGGLVITGGGYNPPRNWFLDLGSDSLIFGTGNGDNLCGLKINGGDSRHWPKDIIIQGGNIIHAPTVNNDTSVAQDNLCMQIGGNKITARNVNVTVGGYNGKGATAYGYDIEISGGRYKSNVNYFRSRCQFDALLISAEVAYDPIYAADSGYSYNVKVHDVKMSGIPHAGIRVDGGTGSEWGVFKIYACSLSVDSRNFTYTSPHGTCYSSANPYAIAVQHAGPGSEIHDNVITSGTSYGGGRGILLESILGTPKSNMLVYNNYIDIHEGPNVEYDETHVENHALRIRNDCQYLHVYGNTIINTGDANTATSSYARGISALRYTFEGTYGGTASHCTIENNVMRAKSLTPGVIAYGVCFDAVIIEDSTLVFRHNRIESDNVLVKYGEINEGARGIRLEGDTLKFLTPSYDPQTYHVGHLCNAFDCSNNLVRDMVYQSGASDTNIIISCTTRGIRELGLQRMLRARILGKNGYPVPGAMVWVINNYRDTILSGLSPTNGMLADAVTYWWESDIAADSTTFNNFILKAKKGSDSVTVAFNISATSILPTAILSKTAGDGTVCDTCLFNCGDVDNNGIVNSLDISYLIQYIYKHGAPPPNLAIADVDGSGTINILDVSYLLNALYKSGPPLNCR